MSTASKTLEDLSISEIIDVAKELMGRRSLRPASVATGLGLFAVGALIGASLALLYAPRPGTELREGLGHKVHDVSEKVSETFAKVREQAKQVS